MAIRIKPYFHLLHIYQPQLPIAIPPTLILTALWRTACGRGADLMGRTSALLQLIPFITALGYGRASSSVFSEEGRVLTLGSL